MAKNSEYVNKQTLYIGLGIALAIGFMGGIIYSSVQSDSYAPQFAPSQQQMPTQTPSQGQGLSVQQANTILALDRRVQANPADADAWLQLANTYFDVSRVAKSIEAYNKFLALRPANANVLTDLGVMYRRNGEPLEAIKAFDKAIELDPNHQQARFNKGIVKMYDLGDIKGAIAVWEESLKLNPGAVAANGVPISQIIEEARAKLGAGAK